MLLNRIIIFGAFCIGSIIKPISILRCKLNELHAKLQELRWKRQQRLQLKRLERQKQRNEQYARISKHKYIDLFLLSSRVYTRREKRIRFYQINGVREYCSRHGLKYLVTEEEKKRTVCIPAYWNKSVQRCEEYDSPETYIAEIDQAVVFGASHALIADGQFLNDMLFADNEGRIDLRDKVLRKVMEGFGVVEEPKRAKHLEQAINLVGVASYNYYHMLIEILPKLIIADRCEEYRDFPVLVDEVILRIPQYKEALARVNQYNHKIIKVNEGEKCEVGRLVHISPNTWMPINLYDRNMSRTGDFLISESYLYNMRNRILNAASGGEKCAEQEEKKRYFISRKKLNTVRLKNEAEIRDLFLSYGFEVLYPEKLSFAEQVEKFSEAECIAGSTGAAFANIIFCQPGTKILCIIPKEFEFHMYSTIAHIFKLDQTFLDCTIVERTRYPAADGYLLDVEYTKELLESLEKAEDKEWRS